MNKILQNQLSMLQNFNYFVPNSCNNQITDDTSQIIFYKKQFNTDAVKIVFENYFVTPFEGFDFHDKYNNGKPPYAKEMIGVIIKQTEKMYYFKGHSTTSDVIWEGWVPKKSCKVQ